MIMTYKGTWILHLSPFSLACTLRVRSTEHKRSSVMASVNERRAQLAGVSWRWCALLRGKLTAASAYLSIVDNCNKQGGQETDEREHKSLIHRSCSFDLKSAFCYFTD